ncbi:ATP-binding protein [Bacilliculturomica massiliensis]|uniref:ATP-binding protein n=1 Tax=Bacilliculturomica massiliensis TaxID=1917867 RepID=UPI001030F864|nr:ATP-binding protein [Bacilliculturomica massiliensis]
MGEPMAGKFLLEILTKGMYSNPMHVYREYIQNSTDSIDKAVASRVISTSEAAIHIQIDSAKQKIIIHDNGCGIPAEKAREVLLSIGDSEKNGIDERGFRGIGRLAGLAYAEEVRFITSAYGEKVKTVLTCDCIKMQRLLQKSNTETTDVMETFMAISSFADPLPEDKDTHFFEVQLMGVPSDSGLLEENAVWSYLSETAPVDFNSQQFSQAQKIRDHFIDHGCPISCYKILRGSRKLPIYKAYSRTLSTGKQTKTKNKDYIRDVEFVYAESSDGQPLYIGWLALTDFSGIISDETIQGIRFRKGNILVGDNTTFVKYFPSEGHNANRMFAGEIHVLHNELVPNSQRDDFEPNAIYSEMTQALRKWAGEINRKYRRGMSEATSALRRLNQLNAEQKELEEKIDSGAITSDEKREQIADKLKQISKKREAEEKIVKKAQESGTFDDDRKETVEKVLSQTERAAKKITSLNKKIVNVDYATKHDLPTSYSRDERKLYQRIITVIDTFFTEDHKTAEKLREAIKSELSVKKK